MTSAHASRPPSPRRRIALAAIAAAVAFSGVTFATLGGAGGAYAADADLPNAGPSCTHVVDGSQPAAQATSQMSNSQVAKVASINDTTATDLTADAKSDPTLWLDSCGHKVYVEQDSATEAKAAHAAEAASGLLTTQQASGNGPVAPLANTLQLNSRPGSKHTIYLDFVGGSVAGTEWNTSDWANQSTINVPPYQLDGDTSANFTDNELTQIQRAWADVAEDYAPFDVNVTTQNPGFGAIDRASPADDTFGAQVFITAGGTIYDNCGCGGISYVGIYDYDSGSSINHSYYQPSWVFTNGTSPTDGKYFGEAISHEVGHQFGLSHDGTNTQGPNSYFEGSSPWAPIMGAGYYDPVAQWSQGEYPDANNTEDDTAIIGNVAGWVGDDYGNDAAHATVLPYNTDVNGLIGTRSDVDAFMFTATGPTLIHAAPSALQPNLDLTMTVLDSTGKTVAKVDPAVVDDGGTVSAGGLGADYSLKTSAGRTYTVLLDGTGSGDPAVSASNYSDYDSMGTYQISLSGDPSAVMLVNASDGTTGGLSLDLGTDGNADVTPFDVVGGTGPFVWSATGLPKGLALDPATGHLSGTAWGVGTYTATVTVTDAENDSDSATLTINVDHAEALVMANRTVNATALVPVNTTLQASGGTGTYTYASSDLPPWATLSADGTLTGTPTDGGTSTFHVTVTSGSQTATATISIDVIAESPVSVVGGTVTGYAGIAFDNPLQASGGSDSYVWSASGLPAGVTLSSAGILTGTPASTGTYTFTATATDAYLDSNTATGAFTLKVNPTPAQLNVDSAVVNSTLGMPMSYQLHASGGTGTYLWSASHLPAGLSLNAKTGVVSGTPSQTGAWEATVTVVSGPRTATVRIQGTVADLPLLTVLSYTTTTFAGVHTSLQLAASGGTGTYIWTATNLPAGLTLSGDDLVGTMKAGSYAVNVTAHSGPKVASGIITLEVMAPPAAALGATSVSQTWTLNKAVSVALRASGGTGAYTWSKVSGSLPSGVSLSSRGVLSGKPTKTGTFHLGVKVTSGVGADLQTTTAAVRVRVDHAAPTFGKVSLPRGHRKKKYRGHIVIKGTFGALRWTHSGTLPAHVSLRVTKSGRRLVLAGKPTKAGKFRFWVKGTDTEGHVISRKCTITIKK